MRLQSLAPVINENSELLILGSMPGKISLQQQQYYANSRNHFWPLMFHIFNVEAIDEYRQRLEFILSKRIALWDVLKFCDREGSLDSAIRNEEVNDFAKFFATYPKLKWVIFNGTKAKQAFVKHVKGSLENKLTFYQLPSTSPTPGKNVKNFEQKIVEWMIVKELLDKM